MNASARVLGFPKLATFRAEDAPPFVYGRDGTLPSVNRYLQPGALIVMDDARRMAERRAIQRWLKTRPGLDPIAIDPGFGGENGHGVAVLRYNGDPRRLPSATAFIGCSLAPAGTWRHARWKIRAR